MTSFSVRPLTWNIVFPVWYEVADLVSLMTDLTLYLDSVSCGFTLMSELAGIDISGFIAFKVESPLAFHDFSLITFWLNFELVLRSLYARPLGKNTLFIRVDDLVLSIALMKSLPTHTYSHGRICRSGVDPRISYLYLQSAP